MDFILKNGKAIVGFVLAIVIQAVTEIITGTAGIDLLDWQADLRYVGLALLAAVGVWLTGNKLDLSQILAATKKLDTHEQAKVAQETLDTLPDKVSDAVVAGYPSWNLGPGSPI